MGPKQGKAMLDSVPHLERGALSDVQHVYKILVIHERALYAVGGIHALHDHIKRSNWILTSVSLLALG